MIVAAVAALAILSSFILAARTVLVVYASDPEDRPIPEVQLGTKGVNSTSQPIWLNLGRLYGDEAKYDKAEALYQRTQRLLNEYSPPDQDRLATTLHYLGALYLRQGRYAEARQRLGEAFAIRNARLSPGHPLIADSLLSLGTLDRIEGRYPDAEPRLKQAREIWEGKFGSEDSNPAKTGHTILSNDKIVTDPEAVAQVDLGPLGRMTIREGTAVTLNLGVSVHVKSECARTRIGVFSGQADVESPRNETLGPGAAKRYPGSVQATSRVAVFEIGCLGGRLGTFVRRGAGILAAAAEGLGEDFPRPEVVSPSQP